jgi:hypothetical protein
MEGDVVDAEQEKNIVADVVQCAAAGRDGAGGNGSGGRREHGVKVIFTVAKRQLKNAKIQRKEMAGCYSVGIFSNNNVRAAAGMRYPAGGRHAGKNANCEKHNN